MLVMSEKNVATLQEEVKRLNWQIEIAESERAHHRTAR